MSARTPAAAGAPLTWNLWSDLEQLFTYHFMITALWAATITAVVAGAAGWFMVLRRQTFAGHTLSVVAFPGAAGALWLGVSAQWGYFGFCLAAALVIAASTGQAESRSLSDESALTGVVQAFALACGFLFVVFSHSFLDQTQALLFGTLLGITDHQVVVLAAVAAGALAVLGALGRRLLFSSIDPAVAAARGVPNRLVSVLYLATLGVAVAEVSQITGALLVFTLLVMPAAAAQRLSTRPAASLGLSVALALAVAWIGVAVSYYSTYPTGFWIASVGFAVYCGATAVATLPDRLHRAAGAPPSWARAHP